MTIKHFSGLVGRYCSATTQLYAEKNMNWVVWYIPMKSATDIGNMKPKGDPHSDDVLLLLFILRRNLSNLRPIPIILFWSFVSQFSVLPFYAATFLFRTQQYWESSRQNRSSLIQEHGSEHGLSFSFLPASQPTSWVWNYPLQNGRQLANWWKNIWEGNINVYQTLFITIFKMSILCA